MTRLRQAPTWQAKSEWETKIIEHFRFFRVFRGQKGFYLPTKHSKRRENFKGEDRLVHVAWAEESILLFLLVSFRVFRGQKRFIYPPNTLKDAKFQRRRSAGSCCLGRRRSYSNLG